MSRKHRPKARPWGNVYCCVMTLQQARQYERVYGPITMAYRCNHSRQHIHLRRSEVAEGVLALDLEWFGIHHRVATWAEHKIWAKTQSGPVHVMQLVEPGEVAARGKAWG